MFKIKRPAAVSFTLEQMPKVQAMDESTMGLIQGQEPMSREEWRVAVALWKYKVTFEYQVSIRGGMLFRGGQVVDFICYLPTAVPLQVFGEHWHKGQLAAEDQLNLAILGEYYGREPIVLWGSELATQEQANQVVKERLGL